MNLGKTASHMHMSERRSSRTTAVNCAHHHRHVIDPRTARIECHTTDMQALSAPPTGKPHHIKSPRSHCDPISRPQRDEAYVRRSRQPPKNCPRVLPLQGARDALGNPEGDRRRGGVLCSCPVASDPVDHATEKPPPYASRIMGVKANPCSRHITWVSMNWRLKAS